MRSNKCNKEFLTIEFVTDDEFIDEMHYPHKVRNRTSPMFRDFDEEAGGMLKCDMANNHYALDAFLFTFKSMSEILEYDD